MGNRCHQSTSPEFGAHRDSAWMRSTTLAPLVDY
jgi:hypothetical protein